MDEVQESGGGVLDEQAGPPDAESAGLTAAALATFALGLGVVALISAWTGWGGIVVGVVAIGCAVYAFLRRRSTGGAGSKRAVVATVLAVAAVVLGILVLDGFAGGDSGDPAFGRGLTLDQCMAQAPTAKLQHVCKSQHLTEYQQRYPNAEQ